MAAAFADGQDQVLPSEGGIIILKTQISPDWDWQPVQNIEYFEKYRRDVVFPGEQVHMVVYLTSIHPRGLFEDIKPDSAAAADAKHAVEERRKTRLFEAAKRSHYSVSLTDPPPRRSRSRLFQSPPSESDSDWSDLSIGSDPGCHALPSEKSGFDPSTSGGLARQLIATRLLPSGHIVTVLEVSIPASVTAIYPGSTLGVIQYERVAQPSASSAQERKSMRDLPHWIPAQPLTPSPLLPPPAPSLSHVFTSAIPSPWSLSPSLSMTSSSPAPAPAPLVTPSALSGALSLSLPTFPHSLSPSSGAEGSEVGKEGPGITGLEGRYHPSRRWLTQLSVLSPVAMQTYHATYNTTDLICLTVQNVLPARADGEAASKDLLIQGISVETIARKQSSVPLPVQLAPIQQGDGLDAVPGLSLRPGEEFSFVLRPCAIPLTSPITTLAAAQQKQLPPVPRQAGEPQRVDGGADMADGHDYTLVVSCQVSHYSGSLLYFRHPLSWRPRPKRDLLLSVTAESPPTPSAAAPFRQLAPQRVTVRAMNLTSQEQILTLLAPSSASASALSHPLFRNFSPGHPALLDQQQSFPRSNSAQARHFSSRSLDDILFRSTMMPPSPSASTSTAAPSLKPQSPAPKSTDAPSEDKLTPGMGGSLSRRLSRARGSRQQRSGTGSLSRIPSLPPVRKMDLTIEPAGDAVQSQPLASPSAAELVADRSDQKTHLWLQSVVPLGRIPPFGAAEVQCEVVPLKEGIIALDTLRVANLQKDVVYFPETPLEILSGEVTGSRAVTLASPLGGVAHNEFSGVRVSKDLKVS